MRLCKAATSSAAITPRAMFVTGAATTLLVAALGLIVGAAVEGAVAAYCRDRSFWPWPPWRRSRIRRILSVQVITAVTFYGLALQYTHESPLLVIAAVESTLLIALLFIDLDLRLIPTLPIGVLALLALTSAGAWPGLGLGSALVGGVLGFAGFGVLAILGRRVFGEEVLGAGDANLALAIGCMTGYPLVVTTLVLGILLGGAGAGAVLLLRRGGLRGIIPYGPVLVVAVLIVLVHGNTTRPFP